MKQNGSFWGLSVKISCGLLLAIAIVLLGAGCGGSSSSSSSSSSIPPQVTQSVATLIAQQAAHNLAAGPPPAEKASQRAGRVSPQQVSCTPSSCVFSEQFNVSQACQFGGTTGLAGDVSGSVNSSGTGSINFQVDETFTDCVPVQGYTVNGAPDVTVAGIITMNGGVINFPLQILEGGAVSINGNACNINLTTLGNADGSSTTTGTLCGQSVNLSVQ